MFIELLGNSNLLGIGGFAEKHFNVALTGSVSRCSCLFRVGDWRLFSDDIQERPRQILARAQVRQNALNRGGESQRARAEEKDWIPSNAGIIRFCVRSAILQKLAARGKLHD
jgi:hypothetical protein